MWIPLGERVTAATYAASLKPLDVQPEVPTPRESGGARIIRLLMASLAIAALIVGLATYKDRETVATAAAQNLPPSPEPTAPSPPSTPAALLAEAIYQTDLATGHDLFDQMDAGVRRSYASTSGLQPDEGWLVGPSVTVFAFRDYAIAKRWQREATDSGLTKGTIFLCSDRRPTLVVASVKPPDEFLNSTVLC